MINTPLPFSVRIVDGTVNVGDNSRDVVVVAEPKVSVVQVGGPPGADGVADHTLLSNIGINTHPQIDTHIADTDIHFSDAPADGQQYARQDNSWIEFSSSNGLLSGVWRFNTSITPPPANGRLQFDAGSYAGTTEIDIHDFTRPGVDASNFLSVLDSGDRVYIQDETNSNDWVVFDVIGPAVDNTTYWTLSVAAVLEGNFFSNNRDCLFVIQFGGGAGGISHFDLTDIGINTHAQIDIHIADSTIHLVGMRSIIVENPAVSDDITFFHTAEELVVSQINFVLTGATSATVTVRFAASRSAVGTEVITGGTVVSSLTDQEVLVFNNDTIPAGSWVWIEVTALSGTPSSVTISVTF